MVSNRHNQIDNLANGRMVQQICQKLVVIESFNDKLRDELVDREIFTTLEEVKILIEQWRKEYNQVCPHRAKNYRPPAPLTILTTVTT